MKIDTYNEMGLDNIKKDLLRKMKTIRETFINHKRNGIEVILTEEDGTTLNVDEIIEKYNREIKEVEES